MGLKKLTVDLSNGKSGGLAAYPLHNNSVANGGFNSDKSQSRIFDGKEFRQRSMKYEQPNRPNETNPTPLITRSLPGINATPGLIFDIPPIGKKTIDVDGNNVQVPLIDIPPFTTRFLDNVTDGFIRGGIMTVANRTLRDVIRIGKFMTTPKGIAWSIKQRQLQKSNPRITQPTKSSGAPNQRTWSFGATTLAQVAVSAFGGHVKREGSNPIFESKGYEEWVPNISNKPQEQIGISTKSLKKQDNRLLYLFGNEIISNTKTLELKGKPGKPEKEKSKLGTFLSNVGNALVGKGKYDTKLYSYLGGPDSTYGIGQTTIRKYPVANGTSFGHTLYDDKPWTRSSHGYIPYGYYAMSRNGGLSLYDTTIPNSIPMQMIGNNANIPLQQNSFGNIEEDIIGPDHGGDFSPTNYYNEHSYVHEKTQAGAGYSPIKVKDVVDFRRLKKEAGIDVMYTNYDTKVYGGNRTYHIENRLNRGNPGKLINRGAGVDIFGQTTDGYNKFDLETIDKINALDIFKAQGNVLQTEVRDLIRFQIEAVDTDNPNNSNVMVFRALLDSLKDNYGGKWNTISYNGRGEDFYIYDKFTRSVSFSFKIAAQSRHEMMPLYRKLNYLVSNTAPDYGGGTRMRGPYMKLTIGDWFDRVPGFFKSVNISWKKDYPWEISISHREGGQDKDGMNIVPHVLDISCQYQPIHNFLPQKSVNKSPFIMMHTNNRAIPNDMKKWYQPTIGDNVIAKGLKNEGKVDVKANIARAQIQGWQAVAQTPLYFNDNTKAKDTTMETKLHDTSDYSNYRTKKNIETLSIAPIAITRLPVDSPEIPLMLPTTSMPVISKEGK